jgi:hypothetical protein
MRHDLARRAVEYHDALSNTPALVAHLDSEVVFDLKRLHRAIGAEPIDQARTFGGSGASKPPMQNGSRRAAGIMVGMRGTGRAATSLLAIQA